jgi:surfactin synthase thioesterase subunit
MKVEAAEGPIGAFFSGCVCPTISNDRHIAKLERPVFWQEIKAKGGMPKGFFDHPELMDFFEPILRHDLAAAETYAVDYLRPIELPIHLMYGDDELGRADAGVESWRKLSTSQVSAEHFSGNHFFIFEHLETIVSRVVRLLTKHT